MNVGIDIGSTTIKLVVLDDANRLVCKNYSRHFSEIGKSLAQNLSTLKNFIGEKNFNFALTGSAGARSDCVFDRRQEIYSVDGHGG